MMMMKKTKNQQNCNIHFFHKNKRIFLLNFSRDTEGTNEDNVTSSIDSDPIKTDVITHAYEENTLADDVLDHKIAETTANGDNSDATVFILLSFLF
jgi:hypothetical protein